MSEIAGIKILQSPIWLVCWIRNYNSVLFLFELSPFQMDLGHWVKEGMGWVSLRLSFSSRDGFGSIERNEKQATFLSFHSFLFPPPFSQITQRMTLEKNWVMPDF